MRKTFEQKRINILRRLFSGESYAFAAKKEHSSKGNVKNILDEFVGRSEGVSLERAAEEYQVSEEINMLLDLAYESRIARVPIPELLAAARLSALMKSLNVEPTQLKEHLNMYKTHMQDFGDFIPAALRLSELETETGKTYAQLIQDYEKTRESVAEEKENINGLNKQKRTLEIKVKDLEKEITTARRNLEAEIITKRRNLKIEIDTARKNLEIEISDRRRKFEGEIETAREKLETLQQKSNGAQQVLDKFGKVKKDLAVYKLDFGDFETVTRFCKQIEQLGGNASRAVEILKEVHALDLELSIQRRRLDDLMKAHEKEKESHDSYIRELEAEREDLEKNIKTLKETVEKLNAEVSAIIKKRETESADLNLTISALQQQLKDLLNTHAYMLRVQPDIESVCKALPLRRKELEELERKMEEDRIITSGATAISDLLSKKPSDRDAIIRLLQARKGEARYTSYDESARQSMVKIMAEQGYVPQQTLETMKKDYEEKVSQSDKQEEMWHRIAKRRLDDLTEFQDKLQKIMHDWRKKMDKETDERIVNLIVEVRKRLEGGGN